MRVLFIVERNARRLFDYVRATLAGMGGEIEIIQDRRMGERRADTQPSQTERRQQDRRKTDVSRDLKRFGWVIVRRPRDAGSDGDKPS